MQRKGIRKNGDYYDIGAEVGLTEKEVNALLSMYR